MKKSHIHLKSPGSLFNEFMCKLGFLWHEWASLKRAQFTYERVDTTFFCSTSPLKDPNRLKTLKLV
jgi:hypothetical protein